MPSNPIARRGVNGDPLSEGKLDLPELREVPTPEEWAWTRDFIARRKWREAVTSREKAPHEYALRKLGVDARGHHEFDRFIADIRRFGYADFYYQVRHIYWAIDEFK